MNVNIWGPDFWNVLHSVAIIANTSNSINVNQIFKLMKDLLPCIYCLKSYRIYYDQLFKEKTPEAYILEGNGAEMSWELHNLVNEKLLNQKIEIVGKNETLEKKIKEAFPLLTKTNFIKRANLSGDYSLNIHSLWRMLMILTVSLEIADTIETPNNRLASTYEFILQMSHFLRQTIYSSVGQSLAAILRSSNGITTPKQLFILIAFYQDTNSTNPISIKYLEKMKNYEQLYDTYVENLLAKKCAVYTCQ